MKELKEFNFDENLHCWVCGKEIGRKDGNAKVKEFKEQGKSFYVVYCHICSRGEEENEKFLDKEKNKQKIKTRINLLRGFTIIVAIALWEFSKRVSKWEQIIWLSAVIVIWFLFAIIDEINKNSI
ncbi:MAG: hypothetical protein V1893_03535 [Candidatus Omnitrophota bacterium]